MELSPIKAVHLLELMQMTSGSPAIIVGLLDGHVAAHPDLHGAKIRRLDGMREGSSTAATHGTFVAGILAAGRGSPAPSICPGATLLLRTVFHDREFASGLLPTTTPENVAAGIVDCVDAGARVINLSVALARPSTRIEPQLDRALSHAATRGCIVVAAAGNQGTLGSAAITRHMWVMPVAAFNSSGRPIPSTNLGASVGRRGLGAPGEGVTSLAPEGGYVVGGGTSAAAAFVTGTAVLLWSLFPSASAGEVRTALTQRQKGTRQLSVTPPLLNGSAAYSFLVASTLMGRTW
jgi:subtilisin family serine protease